MSEEPLLTGRRVIAPELPFPASAEVRYKMGLVGTKFDEELQQIMTRSFRCGGRLVNAGDICVLSENGSFTKDGDYAVVIKYMYLPEDLVKKENDED